MARQAAKSRIILDWFTVTYRSAGIALACLVVALVGGVGYWLHVRGSGPRSEAAEAISRATDMLRQASGLRSEGPVEELTANAESALAGARSHFDDHHYDDARRAAIHSENLSPKAIDPSTA